MAHDRLQASLDAAPVSALQKSVVLICFALNMLDGFDVVVVSYAAPAIAEAWTLRPAELGLLFSAGLAGMTAGALVLAPYTDRIGRRRMILISTFVIGLSMVASGWTRSLPQLALLRAVTGIGIGSMLASLTSMVAEYVPARRRSFAVSFLQTGYPVGATVGGFIAASLVPRFGWETLFFAGGALTLLMVPVVALWLPESLAFLLQRRPRNVQERVRAIQSRLGWEPWETLPERSPVTAEPGVRVLLEPARRRATLRLWLAFFLTFFTLYFLLSWIPKLVVDVGFSVERGIQAGTLFNVGAVAGVLVLGWLADRLGLFRVISLFCGLGAVAMVCFVLGARELGLLLLLVVVIGFLVDGGFAGLYTVAARLYPASCRTTGVGWGIGAGRFGGVAGPYVGGLLAGAGVAPGWLFTVFALPMALAAWVVLDLGREAAGAEQERVA